MDASPDASIPASACSKWPRAAAAAVILGSLVARYAPADLFKAVFVLVAGVSAVRLLFDKDSWRIATEMPSRLVMRIYGILVGILSALMGIGGGRLATMFLTFYGRTIHQAVATSSGVGVIISVPGAIGYVLAGLGKPDLPPLSLGFVSLIGVIAFAPVSVLTAPR